MIAAGEFVDVDTTIRTRTRPRGFLDGIDRLLLFRLTLCRALVFFTGLAFVEWDFAGKAVSCLAQPADEDVSVAFGEEGSCSPKSASVQDGH